MINEKEEFIKAVKNDEHYEWFLNDDVFIHTDVEFDGTFLPTVHDLSGDYSDIEISDLMVENDVTDVFRWYDLEWSESNECWYPVVDDCEYETVDESVWE